MLEFWRAGGAASFTPAQTARRVEAEGWDGQMFMDSQSLGGEPYVLMGAWATSTERLKLSTGVTNPLSRHPAVTAAAAATVQAISGGRAVLGIGRGDSALAHLGYGPVGLGAFERTLRDLQTLLGRGDVAFPSHAASSDAPPLSSLSLGDRPQHTRLTWLPPTLPKVPLDVAATGPKVIRMAAQIAERVTFSVGATAERLAWALELARTAHRQQACDHPVSYGAQIIVICHPDVEAMRPFAHSCVASLARFQVIQGAARGPVGADDVTNLSAIRHSYDMNEHGKVLSDHKLKDAFLTPQFVDRFAIVGDPRHCIERLQQLVALGIERFVIVGPGFHAEATADGSSLFAREVMPAIRALSR
jgi:5,10-methylenetetrahydromethanopterin reductase